MKMFRVVVNDNEYKVGIEELVEESSISTSQAIATPAPKPTKAKPSAVKTQPASEPIAAAGTVIAPMPGTVIQVSAVEGDNVTKGQTLLVLEAMKMENEIMAPSDGVIQEIKVTQGVSVNAGDTLIVLSS